MDTSQTGSQEGTSQNVTNSYGNSEGGSRSVPTKVTADDLLDIYEQDSKAANGAAEPKPAPAKAADQTSSVSSETGSGAPTRPEEAKPADQPLDDGIKRLKAKFADKDFDLPEEATFTEKVNGKDVSFKAKDAVKAFVAQETFNRSADARVQAIVQRERAHVEQVRGMQGNLQKIVDLASQGDHQAIFRFIAEVAGVDPVDYEKKALENLGRVFEVFTKMNPEQRDGFFAKRKAEHLERRLREHEERSSLDQGLQTLDRKVNGLIERHRESGLSRETFMEHYKVLAENFIGEGGYFAKPEDIQPEHVVQYHLDTVQIDKVGQALDTLQPGLSGNDEVGAKVFALVRGHNDLTVSDIADIIKQSGISIVPKAVENLAEKVQKHSQNGFGSQTTSHQGSSKGQKNLEPDDELIDELYRKRR